MANTGRQGSHCDTHHPQPPPDRPQCTGRLALPAHAHAPEPRALPFARGDGQSFRRVRILRRRARVAAAEPGVRPGRARRRIHTRPHEEGLCLRLPRDVVARARDAQRLDAHPRYRWLGGGALLRLSPPHRDARRPGLARGGSAVHRRHRREHGRPQGRKAPHVLDATPAGARRQPRRRMAGRRRDPVPRRRTAGPVAEVGHCAADALAAQQGAALQRRGLRHRAEHRRRRLRAGAGLQPRQLHPGHRGDGLHPDGRRWPIDR